MKRQMWMKNLIIYILLVALVVAGSSMGLDGKQQVLSLHNRKSAVTLTAQSLIANDNLHTFEIRESSSNIFNLRSLRKNYSDFSNRYGLFFLCVLAVLSGVSQLSSEAYVLHSKRYVRDRQYNITFMQDIDGRKRIS